ncbi:MAG: WYL domain-containing protein [Christensenellaceae bacterium]|jgi:predicted DNA-binding transcriptional regulator YafY|nr:WYL domain-containing protein [Christensenellaceae bacterium]
MPGAKLKPLHLLDIFREQTDAEHRLSVPELAEALARRGIAAERKGVYRDIDALLCYGADIIKTPTGYYLNKRAFLPAEVCLLADALRAAPFLTDARTAALLARLSGLVSQYQAELLHAGNMGSIKCQDDELLRALEAIRSAIALRRQLSFLYCGWEVNRQGARQDGQRYKVSPYALIVLEGNCCLVGHAEGESALSHFQLSGIRSVRQDMTPWRHFGEVSEYAARFDAVDYARKYHALQAGARTSIRLLCEKACADAVLTRFGSDTPVQRQDDAHCIATVRATPDQNFVLWAARHAPGIQVLSPPALREQVRAQLTAALQVYS